MLICFRATKHFMVMLICFSTTKNCKIMFICFSVTKHWKVMFIRFSATKLYEVMFMCICLSATENHKVKLICFSETMKGNFSYSVNIYLKYCRSKMKFLRLPNHKYSPTKYRINIEKFDITLEKNSIGRFSKVLTHRQLKGAKA